MKTLPKDASCSNCSKRFRPNCATYKSEGKRPGDGGWCVGWRRADGMMSSKHEDGRIEVVG
jgi:hypothetical protein